MGRRTQNSFIKKKKADKKKLKKKEKFQKKLDKSKLKKEAKENGIEGADPVFGDMLAPELRPLPEILDAREKETQPAESEDIPPTQNELQTNN